MDTCSVQCIMAMLMDPIASSSEVLVSMIDAVVKVTDFHHHYGGLCWTSVHS